MEMFYWIHWIKIFVIRTKGLEIAATCAVLPLHQQAKCESQDF